MKLTAAFLAALTCVAVPAFAVPVSVKVVGPDNQFLPDAKLSWFEVQYTRAAADKTTEQPGANGVFAWDWAGDFADERPLGEKRFLRVRVEAPGMAPQVQIVKQGKPRSRCKSRALGAALCSMSKGNQLRAQS